MSDIPVIHYDILADAAPEAPVIDPVREAQRQVRLANLAKARSARGKSAAKKSAPARKSAPRTAADARDAGMPSQRPAERAEMAREGAPAEVLRRVGRENRDAGWADLPVQHKKSGWDYEWKTVTVLNQPVDSHDFLEIRNAGWRPEVAGNWPMLVEPGTPKDSPIERRGQRLYGRPMSLTMEARQEDLNAAQSALRDKTLQAASGRGDQGIPSARGTRAIPIEASIWGEAGTGTGRGS